MNRYFCPYCSPLYQFYKQRSDGTMICGQCGDSLEKVPLVKPTQIFAIIAATAFISPLIFMLLIFLKDPYSKSSQESLISIGFKTNEIILLK